MNYPPGTDAAPKRYLRLAVCPHCRDEENVHVVEHLGAIDLYPDACKRCGTDLVLSEDE